MTAGAAPRIAAVVPTYDRGALVVRAVESVLAQTRPADEIVVVDDGSTDDTLERLATLPADRVRVVSQANAGAAAARNRGVAESSCEWVAFLDSDDVWVPRHLELVAAAIDATAGAADLYFGDTTFATPDGGESSWWREAGLAISRPYELVADAAAWVFLPVHPMLLQASVVSRRRFLQCGGLWTSLRLREDTHFFFKIGVGRPACAVAGAGAQMTADGSGGRLTELHSPRSLSYWWDTVYMYGDLLAALDAASPELRDRLRRRLAVGHWRMARLLAERSQWQQAALSLGRALAAHPTEVPRHLVGAAGHRLARIRR